MEKAIENILNHKDAEKIHVGEFRPGALQIFVIGSKTDYYIVNIGIHWKTKEMSYTVDGNRFQSVEELYNYILGGK